VNVWLVRHAKSTWSNPGQRDFDRLLNARGERDGPAMSRWLSQQTHPATWIWSSDAVRARTTAEFVRQGFSTDADHLVELHELYGASPETMLEVLQQTPPDIRSAAVVAHNPGTTELLNLLTGVIVTDNVPTFGVARLRFDGSWADLKPGRCELEVFAAPKTIRQKD
jgi:phosphohistidine phosphatase